MALATLKLKNEEPNHGYRHMASVCALFGDRRTVRNNVCCCKWARHKSFELVPGAEHLGYHVRPFAVD